MAGDVKLRLQYVSAEPELFPMGEKEKENLAAKFGVTLEGWSLVKG